MMRLLAQLACFTIMIATVLAQLGSALDSDSETALTPSHKSLVIRLRLPSRTPISDQPGPVRSDDRNAAATPSPRGPIRLRIKRRLSDRHRLGGGQGRPRVIRRRLLMEGRHEFDLRRQAADAVLRADLRGRYARLVADANEIVTMLGLQDPEARIDSRYWLKQYYPHLNFRKVGVLARSWLVQYDQLLMWIAVGKRQLTWEVSEQLEAAQHVIASLRGPNIIRACTDANTDWTALMQLSHYDLQLLTRMET